MNSLLLKSHLKKYGETQMDLANALGISLSCVNDKINGKADFRQTEILYIKDRYRLNAKEIDSIFFTQ